MALVRQPKTAGFRLKSRYEYIVGRLPSVKKALGIFCKPDLLLVGMIIRMDL